MVACTAFSSQDGGVSQVILVVSSTLKVSPWIIWCILVVRFMVFLCQIWDPCLNAGRVLPYLVQ